MGVIQEREEEKDAFRKKERRVRPPALHTAALWWLGRKIYFLRITVPILHENVRLTQMAHESRVEMPSERASLDRSHLPAVPL